MYHVDEASNAVSFPQDGGQDFKDPYDDGGQVSNLGVGAEECIIFMKLPMYSPLQLKPRF